MASPYLAPAPFKQHQLKFAMLREALRARQGSSWWYSVHQLAPVQWLSIMYTSQPAVAHAFFCPRLPSTTVSLPRCLNTPSLPLPQTTLPIPSTRLPSTIWWLSLRFCQRDIEALIACPT